MAEHNWILEHLESYLAGGLEADERARLEQHVAACEACGRALGAARALDDSLGGLFAPVRPTPELEDRMIQSLRAARPRVVVPWLLPLGAGVAALFMLGVVGSFALHLTAAGPQRAVVANSLKQLGVSLRAPAASAKAQPADGTRWLERAESWRDANGLAEWLQSELKDRLGAVKELSDLERKGERTAAPTTPTPAGPVGGPGGGGRGANLSVVTDRPQAALAMGAGGVMGETPTAGTVITNGPASGSGTTWNYYSYVDGTAAGKPVAAPALGMQVGQPGQPAGMGGVGGGGGFGRTAPPGKDKAAAAGLYYRPADAYGVVPAPDEKAAERKLADREARQAGAEAAKDGKALNSTLLGGMRKPTGQDVNAAQENPPKEKEPAAPPSRRIIRTGEIEFEIDSFDDATAKITQLIGAIPGGFVGTINSEKLPNGKVRGSVVVRVPPEKLDALLLDLRRELGKRGELKGQRIGSQDITKQYTDLESRLRAARAMEERLIQIIKTGKGEIKDLVVAEKELGVWRTKIEEFEGELRYFANQVALSTLTIVLTEKEIRAPVGIVEIERVQMGIEVEDVEKAQREALAAVAEAKGQITKAELKQHSAGQYAALLHFSATPDKAGPLRDRLKQLGTVARLDVDRTQQAEGGTGKPADGKVTRQDVQFVVSIYNLANIAPRETVHLQVAAPDAEAAYKAVLEQVRKALGRVVTSDLNRQRNDQTKGVVHFEVKTAEADAVLAALKDVGEVMSLQVTENPDTQNVTRAKRGFQVQIWSLASVAPRETAALQLAARDVPAAYRAVQLAVTQAKGRVLNAQLNEQDRQNISAQLDFEVRRSEEAAVETALAAQGDVYSRNVSRAAESEITVDTKVRFQVKFINAASLSPRETFTVAVEVREVDQTAAAFSSYVAEAQGRVVQSQVAHVRDGQITAKLVYDVPLAAAPGLVEKFKSAGIVRALQAQRNPQVPDSKLAVARLDVTLSNAELIVAGDDGLWPQIRTGLKASFTAIAWSLTLVIIGVCVVLPWAAVLYAGYLLVLRLRRRNATAT